MNKTDSCESNPSHRYSIFIPEHEKQLEPLTLLIVIDPHGAAQLAVSNFRQVAEKYPVVVVASELVQNNDTKYMQELEELITDVKSRYPVGNEIYLAGFSGGARMAISYASTHAAKGVIACGAFANKDQISAMHCRVLDIVGLDDFNFMEAAQFIINPASTPTNALIEITKASHSWPDKLILTQAFAQLQLSSTSSTTSGKHKQQIEKFAKEQKAYIDSRAQRNEPIQAFWVARNMASSPAFEKVISFQSMAEKLMNTEAYSNQQKKLMGSIQFEMKVRDAYLKAILDKDVVWWEKEISSLNAKVKSEPDLFTQMAFRRIKGFLGIVCYSYCNRFIARNNIADLEQTLVVYRLVEPENTDMQNFSIQLEKLKAAHTK